MSLPQLPSGAPQKQRQHHHGDDGDAHHHDQHPQQPSEPSRQRRRTRHRDDANPTAEPLIRQPSPVAQTGSTRRLQKPQISTPAAGVGASVGAGVQPVRDGRYSMPRRRSLRLTKERLDNPNDMDGPAPARNSRGRNPKRSSPEVGSLGARPGRQFTVGNIGNNGLIYLRPVVRPGNELRKTSPPPSVLPLQVPVSHPHDHTLHAAHRLRPTSSVGPESLFSSNISMRRLGDHTMSRSSFELPRSPLPSVRKRTVRTRPHSFSASDDRTSRPSLGTPGTFKVVIHRPSVRRNNTAPRKKRDGSPALDVRIPHYRLGRPQFGASGKATLRLSAALSDEKQGGRSANRSQDPDSRMQSTSRAPSSFAFRQQALPEPLFYRQNPSDTLVPRASVLVHSAAPSGQTSTSHVATNIFDEIMLNPDDPSVVRYSPTTHEISAATPSRLIAHITSPNFLDYELLSDFFLTFRAFLLPSDLVTFLVTRLRWAVDRTDDFGRIVRVRTFVALRHWILNYFIDDFAPDFALRIHFCDLVNGIFGDLQKRAGGGGGDLKIIGELKKCWRRTCALYWSTTQLEDNTDEDISPGGQLGSIYSGNDAVPPSQGDQRRFSNNPRPVNVPSQRSSGKQESSFQQHTIRSITSAAYSARQSFRPDKLVPLSPTSIQSLHVVSCSIPVKPIYRTDPNTVVPLFPHPVPSGTITPQLTASYPGGRRKRGESPVAGTRDRHTLLSIASQPDSNVELSLVSGSLVHGALYQPASPYFEFRVSSMAKPLKLTMEVPKESNSGPSTPVRSPTDKSGGMGKLFGSVRRALSSTVSPFAYNHSHANGSSHSGHAADSKSSLANQPAQAAPQTQQTTIVRTKVRIDILAARAGESFRRAVAEELALEATGEDAPDPAEEPQKRKPPPEHLSSLGLASDPRFHLNRSVTVGSRSIVIVDDTNPDLPLMPAGLAPGSQGTMSVYENYMSDAAKALHQRQEMEAGSLASRGTSEALGEKGLMQGGAKPEVYVPKDQKAQNTVYVPTGFQEAEGSTAESDRLRIRSSKHRFTNSMRADVSPGPSLRKYASYHSGFAGSSRRRSELPKASPGESGSMSSDTNAFVLDKPPVRQLRRRPGGDLKAVNNVHDLVPNVQRRHSIGSMDTPTQSAQISMVYPESMLPTQPAQPSTVHPASDSAAPTKKPTDEAAGGDAASTKLRKTKSISLIHTHSSQPNLRPSFEAEVAKLKALPDDESEDGGVDAALLKLEGKYEKRSPDSSGPRSPLSVDVPTPRPLSEPGDGEKHEKHHKHVEDIAPAQPEDIPTQTIDHGSQSTARASRNPAMPPGTSVMSEESYSSIPLLDRGVSEVSAPNASSPAPELDHDITISSGAVPSLLDSASSSIEVVEKTDSMNRIQPGETIPRQPSRIEPITSFLLDEDPHDHSDDSGALGRTAGDGAFSPGVMSFFDDADEERTFRHPLRQPDTPPARDVQSTKPLPPDPTTFNQGLPTPGLSPTGKADRFRTPSPPHVANEKQLPTPSHTPPAPPHLPFILAYDAEVLAQQFTIVEKDALDELDWRELIENRWKQSSPPMSDWVTYLRSDDAYGVDLIIARFNLVVKWVISEILLTDSVHERVRCIVQYIRVASAARRIRNFATMYQITVALLSADCTRLKKTWELVGRADVEALHDLERIVQPLKNFHNLRVEMETGSGEEGCIPFIGIYTRDLVYNAQKPLLITSHPASPYEPLVNFERHHTAATVVKSLLRLLEASGKYRFQPEPEVLAKCLWVAALSEEEIAERGRMVE